jgi:hypothetical protein
MSMGPGALEALFERYGVSDSVYYINTEYLETEIFFDIYSDQLLSAEQEQLLTYNEVSTNYKENISYEFIELNLEESDYNPFNFSSEDHIVNNAEAFTLNSKLSFQHFNLENTTIVVGCENSIFSSSFMDIIKDIAVSYETIQDNYGNVTTNILIDTEVANSYFDIVSNSEAGLFSGLIEYRTQVEDEFEQQIRAIRTEPVLFDSESSHIVSPRSPLTDGDVLSFTDINSLTFDKFTEELNHLELSRMDWLERIQTFYSHQNPDRQPFPSWSEVPTRPEGAWELEQWERDNEVRKFWATRLNGGYEQTNLVVQDFSVEEQTSLVEQNSSNEGGVQDIFDEDLCLDLLFSSKE